MSTAPSGAGMRIHLAATSEGYALGRELEEWLGASGYDTVWHGAEEYDEGDDYPVFAVRVGRAVIADEDAGIATRGVVVGGGAAGESIALNKVAGVRAVPGVNVEFVRAARRHSDADAIAIGAQLVDAALARELIGILIDEPFEDRLDDARRIVQVSEFESSGTIEGWLVEG